MIPMSCPSCGRRGNIPPDRLNTRMHCKKCDAVFYMDPTGRLTLGEPPKPKAEKAKAASRRKKDDIWDPFVILGKVPRPLWWLFFLGLFGLFGYWMYGQLGFGGPKLPENVEQAAQVVAEAWNDYKLAKLKKYALDGTEAGIEAWYNKTRATFGEFEGEENRPVINPTVQTQDEKTANVEVQLLPGQEKNEKGERYNVATLSLNFVKDDLGYWRLDGNTMASQVGAAVPTSSGGEAGPGESSSGGGQPAAKKGFE